MLEQTDTEIQEIARVILGRELTAAELLKIRGMCRPGAKCPIHPRIRLLARQADATQKTEPTDQAGPDRPAS